MTDDMHIYIKVKKGLYKKFDGTNFIILGQGQHASTKEELVFMVEINTGNYWAESLNDFLSAIIDNGKKKNKFSLLRSYE